MRLLSSDVAVLSQWMVFERTRRMPLPRSRGTFQASSPSALLDMHSTSKGNETEDSGSLQVRTARACRAAQTEAARSGPH